MVIETILICISFIILILASISDLKTREIPDTLSYSFLVGVLCISLIYSLFTSFTFFITSLIGGIITFSLFYVLYLLKQMGGGDVKLLTTLGVILSNLILFDFPLIIIFLILLLFIGGIYSLIWGLFLFFNNYSESKNTFLTILHNLKNLRLFMIIVAGLLLIVSLFLPSELKILFALIILAVFLTFYLFIFIKVVESLHFIKQIKLEELTEGDWLAKDVYHNGKLICSSKKPCLDKKQIQELKKNNIKRVLIKIGIPFVPAILISFVTTIILYGILG